MKRVYLILGCILLSGCNNDISITPGDIRSNFNAYCKLTGGVPDKNNTNSPFDNNYCICGSLKCLNKACTDDGKYCDERICYIGERRCKNDDDNIGFVQICGHGESNTDKLGFYNETVCKDNNSCKENKIECGECKNQSKQCKKKDGESYTVVCINGVYDEDNKHLCDGECKNENECEVYKKPFCENDKETLQGKLNKDGATKDCTDEENDSIISCNKTNTDCGDCLNNKAICIPIEVNENGQDVVLNIELTCDSGEVNLDNIFNNPIVVCNECQGSECHKLQDRCIVYKNTAYQLELEGTYYKVNTCNTNKCDGTKCKQDCNEGQCDSTEDQSNECDQCPGKCQNGKCDSQIHESTSCTKGTECDNTHPICVNKECKSHEDVCQGQTNRFYCVDKGVYDCSEKKVTEYNYNNKCSLISDVLYSCFDGIGKAAVNCKEGYSCTDEGKCEQNTTETENCSKDEIKCKDDILLTCNNGTWKKNECEYGCNSDIIPNDCNKQDNNLCSGKKNGVYCNNTQYFICKDNTVEASNDLQSNQMCSNVYNGAVYSCKDIDDLQAAKLCSNGCDHNGCKDNPCEESDTKCENGYFSYCHNSKWSKISCHGEIENVDPEYKKCQNDKVCVDICVNEQNSMGVMYKYSWDKNNGYEVFKDYCDSSHSCKTENGLSVCGDCKNNTTQCNEDKKVIETCENGEWNVVEECPNGCDPVLMECKNKDKDEEGTCFKFDTAPKDTIKSIWIKHNDTGDIDISNASACTDNDCQYCDTTCQIDNSNTVVYSGNFSAVYSCEKGQPINITCFDSDPSTCQIVQGKCDQMCNVNKDFNECKIKISNEKYYKCHCINDSYEISKCESNCTSVSNEC